GVWRVACLLNEAPRSGPAYAATKFEVKLGGAGLVDRTRIATTARTGQAGIDALLTRYQVTRLEPEFPTAHDPDLSSCYVAHLPAGISLAAALGAFRAEPGVEAADPIAILPVAAVPNDSLFQYQYRLAHPTASTPYR